ncbi:MAG: response regulator [Cyanobacteria bacterium J06648_16]
MLATSEPQGILIVDDNPTNLEVLSEALIHEGFQVAVAIDGESALEQVVYHRPELILLDVMMPGIDGFETCRRLKSNPDTVDIPIIFMTALADTENKVSGLSLGAVDYITKPFQHEEVLARVRVHLQLQNLAQTLKTQNCLLKDEIERREVVEQKLVEVNQDLESLNQKLEDRVIERTQELSEALQTLKQTQVQLIQQEKLSALGQMVAGIAHEINNPVNFIHGNITHAEEYSEDLVKLLRLYQLHYPEPVSEIVRELQAIDFEFLAKDLPKLIQSMQVGTDRIRDIVLSLRNFSRLDEAEVKSVNIHEGINSTLMILGSRLKAQPHREEIVIVKRYSLLPHVKCFPGQLNQVFMNILSNAIDALEEKMEADPSSMLQPTVTIETRVLPSSWVQIRISDNGPGIPLAVQQRIFDPFFTTKPIGKGTGLGMSISYQIVTERHGGKLHLDTDTQCSGTCFTIEIPIEQLLDD